jgi:recombination protein RecT
MSGQHRGGSVAVQRQETQNTATALTVREIKDELERIRTQVEEALPKQMDPDRFLRVVAGAITKNPDILRCDKLTIFRSVLDAAQLGLEPTGLLGSAYLVPYGRTCTLIPGYRGLIDLARRSGEIESIYAQIVRSRDVFRIVQGTDPGIIHEPYIAPPLLDARDEEQQKAQDPGPVIGAYMVAVLRDRSGQAGIRQIEWMTYAQIEAVRKRSRASGSGPWVTDWDEMARKTVVRRGGKYLPLTPEAQKGWSLDEEAERYAGSPPKIDSGRAKLLASLQGREGGGQDPAESEDPPATEEGSATASAEAGEAEEGQTREEPTTCAVIPPDDGMGMTEACTMQPGHKGPHRSGEGSWPA